MEEKIENSLKEFIKFILLSGFVISVFVLSCSGGDKSKKEETAKQEKQLQEEFKDAYNDYLYDKMQIKVYNHILKKDKELSKSFKTNETITLDTYVPESIGMFCDFNLKYYIASYLPGSETYNVGMAYIYYCSDNIDMKKLYPNCKHDCGPKEKWIMIMDYDSYKVDSNHTLKFDTNIFTHRVSDNKDDLLNTCQALFSDMKYNCLFKSYNEDEIKKQIKKYEERIKAFKEKYKRFLNDSKTN